MNSNPIHPAYALGTDRGLDPAGYLVPGAAQYLGTDQGQADELEGLLTARREGLETLTQRVETLVDERRQASQEILDEISLRKTYLEILILDRYQWGVRPTDDKVYVQLRLEQLNLDREARGEKAGCWRDTVLLTKELGEMIRRTDEARDRERLLGGGLD